MPQAIETETEVDELRHRIMGAVAMLATLARDRGTHYIDLRELNADILRLSRLATENTQSLVPQSLIPI